MKMYAISGLGADERVFAFLQLNFEMIHMVWVQPHKQENIAAYALRLSEAIDTTEEFGLIGLSFGGLVAVEIAKVLNPTCTILISSVAKTSHLKFLFRLIGKTRVLELIPSPCFSPAKRFTLYMFGTERKDILYPILRETNRRFTKWAVLQLLSWENHEIPQSVKTINGTHDKLLRPPHKSNTIWIAGGEHFMIVDRTKQISRVINELIQQRKSNLSPHLKPSAHRSQ